MKIKFKELTQTGNFAPSQWEGITIEGKYFYARYRGGYFSADLAETEEDWWNNNYKVIFEKELEPHGGSEMTTKEMLELIGGIVVNDN